VTGTERATKRGNYDAEFFRGLSSMARRSAAAMLDEIEPLTTPNSVLDVGCGVGSWLAEWRLRGVKDILGIDGTYVDRASLEIPDENFRPTDLSQLFEPFDLGRQFGLVQSLEVAEHLEERNAAPFVASLVRHSDIVLFSAAVPRQGGEHHVNEQWPSYWIGLFAEHGYLPYDVIRPKIWNNQRIDWWYRQNTVLFSREQTFGTPGAFDLVHPEMWDHDHERGVGLREILRQAPSAISDAAKKRMVWP
jgi:SAM-dependent methyltransferase